MVWHVTLDGHGELLSSCCAVYIIVCCLQGREIQTNCFLASYNNRNHNHL